MRGGKCTIVGLLSLFGLSCDGPVVLHYHEERPERVARVTHVHHVCTPACDHYYDGPDVIVIRGGHRHTPGCGHVYDGNHWVIVRRTVVEPTPHVTRVNPGPGTVTRIDRDPDVYVTHVHSARCGCVWHPQRRVWIVVDGRHVHGPGCGHAFADGRWTIRF